MHTCKDRETLEGKERELPGDDEPKPVGGEPEKEGAGSGN